MYNYMYMHIHVHVHTFTYIYMHFCIPYILCIRHPYSPNGWYLTYENNTYTCSKLVILSINNSDHV